MNRRIINILGVFFAGINVVFAQTTQTNKVDFKKITASVRVFPTTQTVTGKEFCSFYVLKNTDTVFLDAKKMTAKLLSESKLKPTFVVGPKRIYFIYPFKAGKTYQVAFSYRVKPRQTMYFTGWNNQGSNQIFTQGQGKKTSYWLPSLDDLNDKIEFDLSATVPAGYRAIANGVLIDSTKNDKTSTWRFDMKHPMSSYLVALVVGKFRYKSIVSDSGVPMKLFYEPEDSLKAEPTYRYSKRIFDYLEKEIGVPFPWRVYKQVPVRDFLYGGMENTTLTVFAATLVIDSTAFVDQNYVRVNAHELAHQWFGDDITQKRPEDHWLQEGFATFYSLLARKQIFGDDYFYIHLYQSAKRLIARSAQGKGESLLDGQASSLTFYQKGAWALQALREKIGHKPFHKAIQAYLEKHAYANVTTHDFISAAEKASGQDLSGYVRVWLKQKSFPIKAATKLLAQSPFLVRYIELQSLEDTAFSKKKEELAAALDPPVNDYIGREAVEQLPVKNLDGTVLQLYKKAFASGNLKVRQAISEHLDTIPPALKADYESLLNDASYVTKQHAVLHLWGNFPQEQVSLLNKTQNISGLPDKMFKTMWLLLNMTTDGYLLSERKFAYEQLVDLTAPVYGFPIRENAFQALMTVDIFNSDAYENLLEGCFHRVWRFRKFCRDGLDRLLQNEGDRKKLTALLEDLPPREQIFLKRKLAHQK